MYVCVHVCCILRMCVVMNCCRVCVLLIDYCDSCCVVRICSVMCVGACVNFECVFGSVLLSYFDCVGV